MTKEQKTYVHPHSEDIDVTMSTEEFDELLHNLLSARFSDDDEQTPDPPPKKITNQPDARKVK